MGPGGYISLWHKFLDWEWYTDLNCKSLFIHCLLRANIEDGEYRGMKIPRGSFFTSVKHLAHELHLSEKQIRGAIAKLRQTKEITDFGASNGTMITVCKYDNYQVSWRATGQTEGKRRANEGRQINNINKNKIYYTEQKAQTDDQAYHRFVDFILGENDVNRPLSKILAMSDPVGYDRFVEIRKLAEEHNNKILDKVRGIENHKNAYTSFNLTLTNWIKKEYNVR